MTSQTDPYYMLQQFVGITLNQDWMHDFDDEWAAAEDFITATRHDGLMQLSREFDKLFVEMDTAEARVEFLHPDGYFDTAEDADAWLRDARQRIDDLAAGLPGTPLVPRGVTPSHRARG